MRLLVLPLLLAGCATIPDGPGVLVLPGTGKSFDQFRFDDHACRQYASAQVGGKTPNKAAADSVTQSAVVGAVIGTAAGGAIGGAEGAAVGAGMGLAGGALAGTDAGNYSGRSLQQRYDFGYQQCMYAKGHKVPMSRYQAERYRAPSTTPPPPPPPAGKPPGVPPDYKPS
jgi:hypothetical protein